MSRNKNAINAMSTIEYFALCIFVIELMTGPVAKCYVMLCYVIIRYVMLCYVMSLKFERMSDI